jgi:hypothetical protein
MVEAVRTEIRSDLKRRDLPADAAWRDRRTRKLLGGFYADRKMDPAWTDGRGMNGQAKDFAGWFMHAAPVHTSWLNRAKRFLRDDLAHGFRHDSFPSVAELQQATEQHIAHQKKKPKPFIWTASALANAKSTRAKAAKRPGGK